jgi:hypothetical protein
MVSVRPLDYTHKVAFTTYLAIIPLQHVSAVKAALKTSFLSIQINIHPNRNGREHPMSKPKSTKLRYSKGFDDADRRYRGNSEREERCTNESGGTGGQCFEVG